MLQPGSSPSLSLKTQSFFRTQQIHHAIETDDRPIGVEDHEEGENFGKWLVEANKQANIHTLVAVKSCMLVWGSLILPPMKKDQKMFRVQIAFSRYGSSMQLLCMEHKASHSGVLRTGSEKGPH